MNIGEYSVNNKVVAWLLVVILVGGGIWGFEQMGNDHSDMAEPTNGNGCVPDTFDIWAGQHYDAGDILRIPKPFHRNFGNQLLFVQSTDFSAQIGHDQPGCDRIDGYAFRRKLQCQGPCERIDRSL